MNAFYFIGRITKEIELRYTTGENPVAVAEPTIAVQRTKDDADFIRISIYGRNAENCEKYLSKGSQIAVSGHVNTGSYEKDGTTRYYTKFVCDRVEFIGGRNSGASGGASQETENAPAYEPPTGFEQMDDDIPF